MHTEEKLKTILNTMFQKDDVKKQISDNKLQLRITENKFSLQNPFKPFIYSLKDAFKSDNEKLVGSFSIYFIIKKHTYEYKMFKKYIDKFLLFYINIYLSSANFHYVEKKDGVHIYCNKNLLDIPDFDYFNGELK